MTNQAYMYYTIQYTHVDGKTIRYCIEWITERGRIYHKHVFKIVLPTL